MSGFLVAEHLSKVFHESEGKKVVIRDVSFSVNQGEFTVIVGPSGCGKSTVLRMLAGLEKPSSGRVLLKGEELSHPSPRLSMVFQSFALFPWRTVLQNVEYGLELHKIPKPERKERALKFIKAVGLEGHQDYYPRELSGGMKQRVGLARALAIEPEVVLLDEPFSAVDEFTAGILRLELHELWYKTGTTFVLVTHNLSEAIELGDKIIVLSKAPSEVKHVQPISLERPRRHEDEEFVAIHKSLFKLLKEEIEASVLRKELASMEELRKLTDMEQYQ
ncbi:MAG: ABC transporter ATP-binding protein [Thermoproteota archaeon]